MSLSWQVTIASHWLPEVWAQAVEAVLRSFDVNGSAAEMRASADTPNRAQWAGWAQPVWYSQECDAAAGAALRIGAPKETVEEVWRLVSGQEADADADADRTTALETFRELLNQAAVSVAAELGQRIGRPVRMGHSRESVRLEASIPAVEVRLEGASGIPLSFALGCNAELARVLFEPDVPTTTGAAAPSTALQSAVDDAAEESLRLLKNVEMDLAVSFGQTTMTLEQAMKLSSGSIVELNRAVTEPVDLLVNESLIARGEVVVVDGNYGVRITEIARPGRRMADLLKK